MFVAAVHETSVPISTGGDGKATSLSATATIHWNVTSPSSPEGSVAVTVTMYVPSPVGAPSMRPVSGSMLSPSGSPTAVNVMASPFGSFAAICSEAKPSSAVTWSPGSATIGAALVSGMRSSWVMSPPNATSPTVSTPWSTSVS